MAIPAPSSTGRRPMRSRSMPTSGRVATLAAVLTPSTRPMVSSVPPSARISSGISTNMARLIAPARCTAHAVQNVRV